MGIGANNSPEPGGLFPCPLSVRGVLLKYGNDWIAVLYLMRPSFMTEYFFVNCLVSLMVYGHDYFNTFGDVRSWSGLETVKPRRGEHSCRKGSV